MNNKSVVNVVEDCDIDKAHKDNPVAFNKNATAFTSHLTMKIKEKRKHDVVNSVEYHEKRAAGATFVKLFDSFKMHSDDLGILNDFVYGLSSYDRTVMWLCQYAEFLETGRKPIMGEILAIEKQFTKT